MQDSATAKLIADSFRRWGYLQADLDPFGRLPPLPHRDLDNVSGAEAEKFRQIYCSKVGIEFMHMPLPDRCDWLAERMETFAPQIDQRQLLERLVSTEIFEGFLHTKYVGSKWFSAQGLNSIVPLLDSILESAAEQGFQVVMMAIAHRARLNTLFHIFGTRASTIFACFEDVDPRSVLGSGDTKYHKGATGVYRSKSGKELQIHLASNPSHLEAVNPVMMGRTRARQDRIGDTTRSKVLCVVIHGDAAFAGQGVAAETLNLADVHGYEIGGTIEIILNNLIGFTAQPQALHSGRFASDIAKRVAMPIFHVNAESPDDVVRVGKMAIDYRTQFQSGSVIDLIGYRRFGHNEVDDPTTTAPVLYSKIKAFPYLYQSYAKKIGVSEAEVKTMVDGVTEKLRAEHETVRSITKQPAFFTMPGYWDNFIGGAYDPAFEVETAVDSESLSLVATQVTSVPAGFAIHPKIKKLLELRAEMGAGRKPIDWAMAEALAFGSLVAQGTPVRVMGQDSGRGTFSQRQAVLYDTTTDKAYTPLSNIKPGQAKFEIYDSVLSEAAVVGFEYGYSRDFPEALVCWEAQFGDFGNGAQIIIDQFLTAGEDKWQLLSGLVMLLPHGYEGMGPEHSSARLERYLQLCGEDNIQVAVPSTAAQYFHLLRRQVLRKWRKPLIVMTPKSMLRAAAASSPIEQFTGGSFRTVLDDVENFSSAERLVVCSGKIAHELRAERKKANDNTVAIITIEQLYPFPEQDLTNLFARYSRASHIVWVQEEPANMGALFFVRPFLERLSGGRSVTTVKRSASASPATGSAKAHDLEQKALIRLALAHYN